MPRAIIARLLGEGFLERVKQVKKEIGARKVVFVEPGDTGGYGGKRTEASEKLLELVKSLGKVEKGELLRRASVSASVLKRLVSLGALVMKAEGVVMESEESALTPLPETFTLTTSQEEALEAIAEDILKGGKGVFLLHGVTGSGKTEVYLRAMEEALTKGKSALYLIPEIALTPQLLGRVKARFGENVAVFHSRVSTSVRHAIWGRVRRGETKLVVGARSAVFSPMAELGVIIVDEEHDGAYKQEEGLKYNGRDLCILKGEIHGATVVLGSATPSAETYFNAKTGSYRYLELPERVAKSHLPRVEVIDLSVSRGRSGFKRYISEGLEGEIEETLKRNETAMLFINRRGFSPSVMCLDCGFVEKCNNCSVSLTLHREEGALFCHYCGEKREVPHSCPRCKGPKIASVGIGTEKLLSFIEKKWKESRVARMDSDSMRKKGAYGKLLGAIQAGEVDILVGTQMIAKGHDFPQVTLVGVVLADLSLSFPDFRASERTFQILTQVAGRAGRRDVEGRVVIQTFQPEHYAVRKAATHDFKGFMDIELSHRSELGYPPFSRLLLIRVSGSQTDSVRKRSREVVELLYERFENRTDIMILGPSPAPIWKMKKRVTYQILVKSHPGGDFSPLMKAVNEEFGRRRGKGGLAIDFDVDPYQLMY